MRSKVFNKAARAYREDFLLQLQKFTPYLEKIKQEFNPKKHALGLRVVFGIPKEYLFTKSGSISRRSFDVDNCLKLPIDFLCNSKYVGRVINSTSINNLAIDDQFICNIVAQKCIYSSFTLFITIEIVPHDALSLIN